MTDHALLVDFGSTFTKVRVVHLPTGHIRGTSQAASTVDSDVNEGLDAAFEALPPHLRSPGFHGYLTAASSSAAGGLRIVAVGLVQSLTAEAAKAAALSAGGRIIGVYADGLTDDDLIEIEQEQPDLILLAGGTDGGDKACLVGNAHAVAMSAVDCHIVIAGNRHAAPEARGVLESAGKIVSVVGNVLPDLDRLEPAPASEAIRDVFMRHITQAKGLARAESRIGRITMPTPRAVLTAVELLSSGATGRPGWGELLCVDIGGATTDVHSVADGVPADPATRWRGLPEPVAKRTVEADLGVRISAPGLVEAAGADEIASCVPNLTATAVRERVDELVRSPEGIPESDVERTVDIQLARAAIRLAIRRHAGSIEVIHTPQGRVLIQTGKDLRRVEVVIGTGGILAASGAANEIVNESVGGSDPDPGTLTPLSPRCFIDRDYTLFAAGLLASWDQTAAFELMRSTLE